jgi:hypothetical protein
MYNYPDPAAGSFAGQHTELMQYVGIMYLPFGSYSVAPEL